MALIDPERVPRPKPPGSQRPYFRPLVSLFPSRALLLQIAKFFVNESETPTIRRPPPVLGANRNTLCAKSRLIVNRYFLFSFQLASAPASAQAAARIRFPVGRPRKPYRNIYSSMRFPLGRSRRFCIGLRCSVPRLLASHSTGRRFAVQGPTRDNPLALFDNQVLVRLFVLNFVHVRSEERR